MWNSIAIKLTFIVIGALFFAAPCMADSGKAAPATPVIQSPLKPSIELPELLLGRWYGYSRGNRYWKLEISRMGNYYYIRTYRNNPKDLGRDNDQENYLISFFAKDDKSPRNPFSKNYGNFYGYGINKTTKGIRRLKANKIIEPNSFHNFYTLQYNPEGGDFIFFSSRCGFQFDDTTHKEIPFMPDYAALWAQYGHTQNCQNEIYWYNRKEW